MYELPNNASHRRPTRSRFITGDGGTQMGVSSSFLTVLTAVFGAVCPATGDVRSWFPRW